MSTPPRSRGALKARAERSYVARTVLLPIQYVIHTTQSSGVVLFAAALGALVWVNSPIGATYSTVWQTPLGLRFGPFELAEDLRHWVNDGLMAVFF